MKEKIIFALAFLFFVFPNAFAAVNYKTCSIGNCPLTINDCSSGLVDFFSSQTCSGNPLYEYTFSTGSFSWYPTTAGTYYAMALCDDGRTYSLCSQIVVGTVQGTTTSTSTTTTTFQSTQTSIVTPPSSDNSNLILYILVIVIIAVGAFIAYRLLTKKKKPKIDYETLYRKWGR